jgi:hypothetical protein
MIAEEMPTFYVGKPQKYGAYPEWTSNTFRFSAIPLYLYR